MFSARKIVPWHGLGTIISECPNAQEAIQHAGLDWEVELKQLNIPYEDGENVEVPDRFAVCRKTDRKYLGTVGDRYEIIQNKDLFGIMDKLLEVSNGQVTYETAGSLKDGKVIWMLANTGMLRLKGFEEIKTWMLCSSSHDGSKTLRIIPTTTRVVCWNTLTLALNMSTGKSQEVRIRHTKGADISLEKARQTLGFIKDAHSTFVDEGEFLMSRQLGKDKFRQLQDMLFPLKKLLNPLTRKEEDNEKHTSSAILKKRDLLEHLFTNGTGNDNPKVAGTLWSGLNAVTEFFTWMNGRNKTEVSETRVFNNWFGTSSSTVQDVRQFLLTA
jgi:phage/plasmid-like protein (TIGR03299 family)